MALYRRALGIYEKALGPNHPEVIRLAGVRHDLKTRLSRCGGGSTGGQDQEDERMSYERDADCNTIDISVTLLCLGCGPQTMTVDVNGTRKTETPLPTHVTYAILPTQEVENDVAFPQYAKMVAKQLDNRGSGRAAKRRQIGRISPTTYTKGHPAGAASSGPISVWGAGWAQAVRGSARTVWRDRRHRNSLRANTTQLMMSS